MKAWWCDFFDQDLAGLILSEPRSGELEFLTEHLRLRADSTVFDQCCGWGRVAGPLSKQVEKVRGVDASVDMVESGRKRWEQVHFTLADATEHRTEPCFDAAMNLYSSFGYTASDIYNFRLLQRLVDSVRPGGRIVLDTINPHRVLDGFQEVIITRTPSGRNIVRRSELLESGTILSQDWSFQGEDGKSHERRGLTKLYESQTLRTWLLKAHCQPLYALGDLQGQPYSRESERLIWVGQV